LEPVCCEKPTDCTSPDDREECTKCVDDCSTFEWTPPSECADIEACAEPECPCAWDSDSENYCGCPFQCRGWESHVREGGEIPDGFCDKCSATCKPAVAPCETFKACQPECPVKSNDDTCPEAGYEG